jgi:hypothetical protein
MPGSAAAAASAAALVPPIRPIATITWRSTLQILGASFLLGSLLCLQLLIMFRVN